MRFAIVLSILLFATLCSAADDIKEYYGVPQAVDGDEPRAELLQDLSTDDFREINGGRGRAGCTSEGCKVECAKYFNKFVYGCREGKCLCLRRG